jgi:hypothetical protein
MRLDEILRQPVAEIAYHKKKAEAVITGLEKPINDHLLELDAAHPGADHREHRKAELIGWLDEVAEIRLRGTKRPAGKAFYFRCLFGEPFGGVEVENVAGRLRRLSLRGYPVRGDIDPAEVAERLRRFHDAFAAGCAEGRMDLDATRALIERFAAAAPPLV